MVYYLFLKNLLLILFIINIIKYEQQIPRNTNEQSKFQW